MITDILLYIISFLLGVVADISLFLSRGWTIWPENVLDGLTYFFTVLMKFNFLFPVDTLLTALIFLLNFEVIYISVRFLMKVVSFFRGSGEMDV